MMPTELLLFLVGIGCAVLGATAYWWCWAKPAIDALQEDLRDLRFDDDGLKIDLADALFDRDEARDQHAAATDRAVAAEVLLGQRLLVEAGTPPLRAALITRGRN